MITVKIKAPDKLFDLKTLEVKLLTAVDKVNDSSHQDFKATVVTFEHEPQFKVERAKNDGGIISASTSTDDENYARLNNGTEDHLVGQGGEFMSFYPGYISKTQPMVLHSNPSRYVGNRQRARGPWLVRGIEPREFDKAVVIDHEQIFYQDVNKAFDETVQGK